MSLPTIVLVGGFLGAGKTSLILSAARILQKRGMRVAAIMNDQDAGLVDTRIAGANQLTAREVAGGCFCCRFSDFLAATETLREYRPEVIFAEPVGSCIDLSATIVQPLKSFHLTSYRVAPLTVLLDPALAAQVYSGHADPNIEYLFRNQIAEADILCTSRADLYSALPALPFPLDFSLSSKSGDGVELWLDHVMQGGRIAGSQLLQVDYSRYAEAEAALGWLNLHADVSWRSPLSPAVLVGPLLEDLERHLAAASIQIAHLKAFDRASSGFIKVSICSNGSAPQTDGDLLADPAVDHELAINLRAIADPDHLARIVSAALGEIQGKVVIRHLGSFRPSPPKPEHRFSAVV